MKRATLTAAVMLIVLTGLATAQLGSNDRIVAQVPFEFMVANKIVPAGEYIVQLTEPGTKMLTIRNQDAKVALLSWTVQGQNQTATSAPTLVFDKYGNQYFLRKIELEDRTSYRLPQSNSEAELLAHSRPAAQEIVRASLR